MSINNNFFQDEIFDTESFESSYYFPPVFSSSDDLETTDILDDSNDTSYLDLDNDFTIGTDVLESFRNDNMDNSSFESEFQRMDVSGTLPGLGVNPNTSQGEPVFTNPGYIQAYLRTQIGRFVRVEFLLGTNLLADKSGLLREVGINYIVLEDASRDLIMCDLYSIKFVTTSTAVEPVPIQQPR